MRVPQLAPRTLFAFMPCFEVNVFSYSPEEQHGPETHQLKLICHLREIRLRRGLRYRDIAEATGLSPSRLWDYEHGFQRPRVDVALRVADFLGLPVHRIWELGKGKKNGVVATGRRRVR